MKRVRTILMVVLILLAILASAWSFQTWRYRGDRLYFVDGCLPKRSFEAFNQRTPSEVQEDILIAHEKGVTVTIIPFASCAILWFLAFAASVIKTKRKEDTANHLQKDTR